MDLLRWVREREETYLCVALFFFSFEAFFGVINPKSNPSFGSSLYSTSPNLEKSILVGFDVIRVLLIICTKIAVASF